MTAARIQRWLVFGQLVAALVVAAWLARDGWAWPTALATSLALPPALHGLVLARHFVFARQAGSRPPPEHRVGASAMLRVWLVETGCSLRAFGWLQPFRERARFPSPAAAGNTATPRVPVLLVHGYMCNRAVWLPLAPRLAARGHVVEAVSLDPPFADLDAHATPLAAAVDALVERTGSPRVALVGHSMGGLAVRAYLRVHGTARVARVVTLGTPHRGTMLASFGLGESARQMRRASDWLAELEASEPAATRALMTVVLTHTDNIVVPQADQSLPGARTVEFSGVGHLALVTDPRVGSVLEAELSDALATHEAASATGAQAAGERSAAGAA